MKKMYTYLQLGLGLLIAWLIPEMGFAQTCDVTPMNISKLATDWTTNCARVATDQCDPTNGPLCSSAANSNWLLLNQNDYCIPKPPCNAVGFSKVEVAMTMEGTWTVKNIGNQSQNTSVGLLGCIKAWVDDMLFDPLEPSAFTGIITLAPNEEKSGALPTRTKTSQYPGDLNDLFAKSCAGTLCLEGLADGFTTLTISNGNLQAVTTVLASLKACVNYQKFTWNVTGTEAACETSADGRVFVNFTPAAGTNASDYEIRVGNGASWTVSVPATSGANVVSGLPAGSYTVAVVYKPLANAVLPSDSESCGYCKASVTIAAATATLSCSSTPDCPGGTGDGTVTVNVTGSNLGTVNYLWNNNRTTATITGLTPGNYTVTVTYGPNGKCSKITTCTVAAAPAVNADISSTNVICNGANNGTITVDPTSGTANYIIAVTGKPNQTSSGEAKVFNNFAPGTYTITVTDANGCTFTGMVTITEPTAVNGTLTPTPAACTGAANGSAIASGSDGTGPYTYNWSRGTVGGGGTTVTGLTPGPISVTITDHNGCTKVLSGTIGTVSEVVITCTPTAERCVDENNGSVSVAVSNAAPNYIASWISGPTQFSQVSSPTSPVVVSNLAPGTYTIRITDNNGCYAECTFTINEGLDLPCSISGGNSICQGVTENTHSVQTVSGATYAWTLESNTAGASIPGSTSNSTVSISIPANATGSYTVRMTISRDGCSKTCTKTVSITQPITCTINGPASVCEGSTATFTTSNVTNRVWTVSGGLSFSGQGTTSITVTIPDGTVLSNFTVGLSGTGSNGCPTNCSTTTVINQKPTSAVQALQPVCNPGLPQGAIRATASGVAPFVYRLYKHNPARTLISTSASTASTTYDFTNLGPGTYDVEVTDASNCTSDPSVTVILVVPVAFEPELDCDSRNAGNIDVVLNITNGTAPFTYSLDNNTFSPVPGNGIITIPFVDGSNQIIYIKDANDCPAISETILLQCCKLAGVCKLTTPAPITGCDRSGIPAAKTNVSDVFDNVTFCEEARLSVETTEAGTLCAGTLSRTYTYTLYDDLNDNNELDDDDVVLEATCAETYVVTAPPVVINCPAANLTIPACTSAADAQILLDNYKALFSFTGGCNAVASFSTVVLPNPCVGGVVSIKYKVVSDCQKDSCTKTITRVVNPSITLNCADNANITTCRTQAQINSDFSNWLTQFSVTGGCNATGSFDGTPTAPLACGGTTTVTYRVVDAFGCNTQTCTRTFTVTPPALVINCPEANLTIPACTSAEAAQTLLDNYKALFSFSGGCNATASFSNVTLPNPCVGGMLSITYTVVSDCETKACTKSITRTVNPPITLTCADNVNIITCKTQAQIDEEFGEWLDQFGVTGGCNASGRLDGEPSAPLACGGTTTVTYRVVDAFGCNTQTCTRTFTVTPPALVINCPETNLTIPACTSASAAQTLLDNYKALFSFSGGCNAQASFSAVTLPDPCVGGTVSITYTVVSDCDTKACTKSITRTVNPAIILNCADNVSITTCRTQTQVNTQFSNWLAQFSVTGGCNATGSFDGTPTAPLACGGTTTVTYRVVDAFGCNTQTCTKTFTVTPPALSISVPEAGLNIPACTSAAAAQTLLNNYKALFSFSGGCNASASFSTVVLPDYCTGGTVSITYTVVSDCDTKSATCSIVRAAEPALSISCPEADLTIPHSLTEAEAKALLDNYKVTFSYHGGCNTMASFSVVTMPDVCLGGETTITYTVTSDCDTKTCTKKIIRIANPVPTVDITVDGPSNFCEKGSTKVIIKTSEQNKPYDIFFTDLVSSVTADCLPKAVGGAYIIQDDENGIDTIELNNLSAGTYKYAVSNVVDRFGCTSALDLSDTVSITAYPIPVGEDFNKTIYSCLPASVNLPLRVKCNVPSTFTWFSVASIGSSVPYDNPNVAGESFNPAGTSNVITDVLTNLIGTPQTIIYRVVPTSEHNCVGEPFYVTVVISPRANIECLACMTQVRVTLDDKCRKLITPNLVVDGFAECPNRELLQEALEVLIDDGNNDSYVDCAGSYKYVIRIKPEFAECFDYQPCWGTIIAEDKTGPIIECVNWVEKPLDCYDVNYVLNNYRTIGKVGETRSPRPSSAGNQIIPNAEGIGEAGTCNLLPPNLVADNIKNLGYVYFRDNCRNCGCRTTVKWNDKVEYYTCEQMRTNGNIYARIYRTWVATDCNGMTADTVQVINFTRPALSDFAFNGPGEGKYDRVVTYNACTADRSWIKKEDVTPYICSFFNAENNPRCLFIDQVECNYSVSIKDTEFPICGGKGLKIDRELYVFDWCAGGIIDTFHILIKIGDFEAPTVEYAHGAPYDISTGPMDCTAAIPVTVAGIKTAFGVTIKDNCALGNVSVSVYTKDRYVKGILVYEGPDIPFCEIRVPELTARTKAELRGDHENYQLGACNKELICWEKVDYAVMNGMMVGLPVGKHLMVIDAFDACYNTSTTCFIFDVKDKIAPVMKCDDDLHVTLSNANGYTSGYAQVSAADIDEGSWDNCKLAWIGVRRNVPDACAASFIAKGYDTNGNGKLDALGADNDYSKADGFDLNGDGDISDFGETFIIKGGKLMTPLADFVEFFCCDLTERVTVELWGGDTSGNTNYCWMDLLIEDKVAPTCIAPWDVTIYCDDKNIAQIDNKIASAKIFGDVTVTTGNDCAALDTVYTTEKKLKCGAGWIDRIWTLTKQTAKGPITITCKQRINLLPVHEYNICFPKDISTDCKTPVIDTVLTDELACDILAVNVSDKRYDASDDECYKVFRTYTVINWCVYDDRCGDPMSEGHVYVVDRATFGNYGKAPLYVLVRDANRDLTEEFYLSKDLIAKNADDIAFKPPYCEANSEFYHSFMYTQIIKVYDSELPVVTGKRDTFCTSPTACTANITKVVTIKDNCTDKVELERQFLMIAPFQTTDAGKMILYSTPRWSVKELGNGQFEISVSNLPEGTHDLIVVGRDECGNLSVATRVPFVVKDCKAPAPICINGLSTELMPDGNGGGMMAVWASDFVASKIYDCNGQGPETSNGLKLVTKYSINRVGSPVVATQTGINLTCADAGKVVLVELHAWDEAGNHDFCVTFVEVQDNRKVCPNPGTVVTGEISGLISTDEAEPVSGVKIDVSGGAQMNQNSTNTGVFNFNNLTLGSDFTVTAQLDKDHLNGVSTFDLVQLQKHILGVKLIDNPYRLIAADVNNSKSISTLDMIQIRKLILNIDQRFNNVPSWRFVDAAYKFPNPSNPWAEAFPEVVNINDLAGKVQANFVAIKMGDVNGSATVSSASTAEVRSSKTLKLSTAEQQLKAGQSYAVAIHAEDLAAVQGFQFTLQVNPAQVQLETIEYNGAMQADHFGFFPQSGQLTSSFVRAPLVGAHSTTLGKDLLFTLHLKAEADGLLSEVLNINSRLTPQEAYSTQDELMNVALEVKDDQISNRAVLHQNTPNPFVEETSIGFYLPEAAEATLTVRDVKGALLYRQEGNFAKGENQILLKHAQLRSSGVLYYTLETADFTASKKMVLINK